MISAKDIQEIIQDVVKRCGLRCMMLDHLYKALHLSADQIERAQKLAVICEEAESVLWSWRQSMEGAATKQAIINALEICGHYKAVEILQVKWDLKTKGMIEAVGMYFTFYLWN